MVKKQAHLDNCIKAAGEGAKLITESYYIYEEDKKDWLVKDKYKIIGKNDNCDYAQNGVMVEPNGNSLKNYGKIFRICTNKNCDVHFPKGQISSGIKDSRSASADEKFWRKMEIMAGPERVSEVNIIAQSLSRVEHGVIAARKSLLKFMIMKFFQTLDFSQRKQIYINHNIADDDIEKFLEDPETKEQKKFDSLVKSCNNNYLGLLLEISVLSKTTQNAEYVLRDDASNEAIKLIEYYQDTRVMLGDPAYTLYGALEQLHADYNEKRYEALTKFYKKNDVLPNKKFIPGTIDKINWDELQNTVLEETK